MKPLSFFIVLIESRRLPRAAVTIVTTLSLLLSGFGLTGAHAAPGGRDEHKLSKDLQATIDGL